MLYTRKEELYIVFFSHGQDLIEFCHTLQIDPLTVYVIIICRHFFQQPHIIQFDVRSFASYHVSHDHSFLKKILITHISRMSLVFQDSWSENSRALEEGDDRESDNADEGNHDGSREKNLGNYSSFAQKLMVLYINMVK